MTQEEETLKWRESCDVCGKPVVYHGGTLALWEIVPTADGGRYVRKAKTLCAACCMDAFADADRRAKEGR